MKSFHSNKTIDGEYVQLLYLPDTKTQDEVVNIDVRVRRERIASCVLFFFTSRMNIYDGIEKTTATIARKNSPKTETVNC